MPCATQTRSGGRFRVQGPADAFEGRVGAQDEIGSSNGGVGGGQLNINYHAAESSDWMLHSVLIWDTALSTATMKAVTAALREVRPCCWFPGLARSSETCLSCRAPRPAMCVLSSAESNALMVVGLDLAVGRPPDAGGSAGVISRVRHLLRFRVLRQHPHRPLGQRPGRNGDCGDCLSPD